MGNSDFQLYTEINDLTQQENQQPDYIDRKVKNEDIRSLVKMPTKTVVLRDNDNLFWIQNKKGHFCSDLTIFSQVFFSCIQWIEISNTDLINNIR